LKWSKEIQHRWEERKRADSERKLPDAGVLTLLKEEHYLPVCHSRLGVVASSFCKDSLMNWLSVEDAKQEKANHFGSCLANFSGFCGDAFVFDSRLRFVMEPHLMKARKTRELGLVDEKLNSAARKAVESALNRDESSLFYNWIKEQGAQAKSWFSSPI
jgi:hypothetical protein